MTKAKNLSTLLMSTSWDSCFIILPKLFKLSEIYAHCIQSPVLKVILTIFWSYSLKCNITLAFEMASEIVLAKILINGL